MRLRLHKNKCTRWRTQPLACLHAVQPLPAAPGDALLPAALQPCASPKSVVQGFKLLQSGQTHATLQKLCGQKKHTRENLAPVRSEKTHTQSFESCAVRKDTHAKSGHQCGQKRHTHTQSFESCAVRKDTHAKSWHQCGQKRHTHATLNCVHTKASKFLRSADRGDTWKYCGQSGTIAVRKDTQARLQILCGQKRHECKTTLLRTAKPTLLWSHVLALTTGRHVTTQNQKNSSSSPSHILCNSSGVFPKVKSNWAASSSLISAKAAASNFSWRSRSILSSSSLTPSP